jgi:DNA invertase Pin-like site-specific DNA recombinase
MARKTRYIAYMRVSTDRQGRSGLGLDAQRSAVAGYLNGGSWELAGEFVEVESGRRDDRPQLEAALAACRLHRARLVVAKVDRLTRSVGFLHRLLDSGVEVEFCDLPQLSGPTGRFMLNQMAAVAELEAGLISQRTRAALAAAKARGTRLGNPGNLTPEGRARGSVRGNEAQRERAASRAADLLPTIRDLREKGTTSLRGIAAALNDMGVPSPRGGAWYPSSVRKVLTLVERG